MATITLPTTAIPGAGARSVPGVANATVAQGQVVYRNSSRKMALAQANAALTAEVVGIMQQSATANAPVDVQTDGIVSGLSGLTAGVFYVLSDSVAGGIMPIADLTTGDYVTLIGYALSATELQLLIEITGLAAA
jgi:hypothetical protein